MKKFQSSKLIDGFSTCYRDYSSGDSQSSLLHGCDIKFRMYFEGDLDFRNWVVDFGWMKRSKQTIKGMNLKDWFSYMFDHTCLIQHDDPFLDTFLDMNERGIIQLRILESTSKEGLEKFLFDTIQTLISNETNNRVRLINLKIINY